LRSPLDDRDTPASYRPRPYRLPLLILSSITVITLAAPLLGLPDPRDAVAEAYLQPPSLQHPFGTDTLGRDVLSRTLWGGRQTLLVALLASGIAIVPGLLLGIMAGYYQGWADRLLMAGMNVLLAFPNLLLGLAVIALIGPGRLSIALAVGLAGLPAYARVMRSAVLQVRSAPYIDAAQAIGVPPHRILLAHVLPNIQETLFSFAGVSLSWAILNGAALAFLGFGGDPAAPDWGAMLSEGRAAFRTAPWIALPPGIAITATIFAANRLADAWQDATAIHNS